MISGKIWGQTELLLHTPLIEVHRLSILPNSHCSMHKHEQKWNAFLVISGSLTIDVEQQGYALTDVTQLVSGGFLTVPPGHFHRFRSGALPVDALEIYYLEPIAGNDIVRKDVGGRD